jgi:hypothetical protein
VTGRRLATAGLACIVGLTACSSSPSAVSYPGTAKLARALNANGVTCTAYAPARSGGPATTGAAAPVKKGAKALVQEAGICSHGKGKLLLFTFKTSALRDRWLTVGSLYGSLVVGPNWSVSTQAKTTAHQIQRAIGGEVH